MILLYKVWKSELLWMKQEIYEQAGAAMCQAQDKFSLVDLN